MKNKVLTLKRTTKYKNSLSKVSNLLNNFYKFAMPYINTGSGATASNDSGFFISVCEHIGYNTPLLKLNGSTAPSECMAKGKVVSFSIFQLFKNIYSVMPYTENNVFAGNNSICKNTHGTGEMVLILNALKSKSEKTLSKVSNLLNNFYKFALHYNHRGVGHANNRKAFFCALNSYIGSIPPCISIMEILPLWCNATGQVEPFFYSQLTEFQTNKYFKMHYLKSFVCGVRNTYQTRTAQATKCQEIRDLLYNFCHSYTGSGAKPIM